MIKRIADRLLRWYCHPGFYPDISGDLEELYLRNNTKGKRLAQWRYLVQVIVLFRPSLTKNIGQISIFINTGMYRNYFLICFRNIRKNTVFSLVNILGLAIGIAACLLILQYVSFESSYDQFHSNKDRVFRVDSQYSQSGGDVSRGRSSSYQLAPTIKETVTGVSHYTRTHMQYFGAVVTYEASVDQRRQFFEKDYSMYFVDQDFFEMFDYKLIKGNRSALLTDPMSIVITESMVDKYMLGESDPIGKFLKVDGGWYPGTYKITGVLADLPDNSLFAFDFLMPIHELLKNRQYQEGDGWGWNNFISYVMIGHDDEIEKVAELSKNILFDRDKENLESSNSTVEVVYSPLNDLHLRDAANTEGNGMSDTTLFFFSLIALLIICIAWLNYINLATAQAMKRAKEIGIRKVVGAVKSQLIFQFLLESFIINSIALVLAIVLAYACLPVLGKVIDASLTLGSGIESVHWTYFGLAFISGTLLSGFYPAVVMSNYRPAVVIKGNTLSGHRKFGLRQVLVVMQLIIGVFLISGTLAVYKQLQFMRNQDLGLNIDQVMSMKGPRVYEDRDAMSQKLKVFKQNIKSLAAVTDVSGSDAIPGGGHNWSTNMKMQGQDDSEEQRVKMMRVDENFHHAFGMELVAGRFHSKDLRGEESQIVVNETMVEKFGLGTPEEAIGKKIMAGDEAFPIIGVLKDYHWSSLKEEKEPILLSYTENGTNISVRLSTKDIANTVSAIQKEYETQFANNPFDYYFMDDFFNQQYEKDRQFGYLFTAFSVIAIVIACLGLFGLASFTLNLRIKEIGIRKVLGATIPSILAMIYKDYMKLILIAAIVGLPIAYLAIEKWLEGYANRIDISADLIVLPIVLLMLITIITIGYQSLRTALANPTTSLRSE